MKYKIQRLPFILNVKDLYKTTFYIVAILIIIFISFAFSESGVRRGIIIGGMVGELAVWRSTMLSEVTIYKNAYVVNTISNKLENFGYCNVDKEHYTVDAHSILKFKSQDVFLDLLDGEGDKLRVMGPYYVIKILLRELRKIDGGMTN